LTTKLDKKIPDYMKMDDKQFARKCKADQKSEKWSLLTSNMRLKRENIHLKQRVREMAEIIEGRGLDDPREDR